MAKLTLSDITGGYIAPVVINANNDAIETALENTLSRDGTAPNTMSANIDLNSFRIINAGDAQNGQEYVTYTQFLAELAGMGTLLNVTVSTAMTPVVTAASLAGARYLLGILDSSKNLFFGGGGSNITTAIENTCYGYLAGDKLTGGVSPAGSFNSLFGSNAGGLLTTGSKMAVFGRDAGDNATTATNGSIFGYGGGHAILTSANVAIFGMEAGHALISANNAAFFGMHSGYSVTGADNALFGTQSGELITTGARNVGVGTNTLQNTAAANDNAALGYGAGINNVASGNIFIGQGADGGNFANVVVIGTTITASAANTGYLGNSSMLRWIPGGNNVTDWGSTTRTWKTGYFGTAVLSPQILVDNSLTGSATNDNVMFYAADLSAGHTAPAFYCEGSQVIASGQADSVSSVRVKMKINGTVVTLLAI